ncbi:GNAT family N-acetyltransferase [Shewanella youngdeokensis]|uniref:GNAT family N-acetyltransferase n=1 Tax=Shewanella youngdeokensis TaxID=2999068 RepID=A0ABZ0K0A2_9GAMM|nr:GNAT family N-acetyltransferase [Shewanella sp. DAU334]
MLTKQITHAVGPLWEQAMSLYCDVFPQWEREPIAAIEQAVNSGESRCILLCKDEQVLGMSLTEIYPTLSFAMLGYLFIAPDYQGQGLGKRLCHELFDFFGAHYSLKWLLVEAESGPEAFYQKLGFTKFNVEYLSPHYDDADSSPMALMYRSKPNQGKPSAIELSNIVEHIFTQSYYLPLDDPRHAQQRQRILAKDVL